jgi:hypothetical protein
MPFQGIAIQVSVISSAKNSSWAIPVELAGIPASVECLLERWMFQVSIRVLPFEFHSRLNRIAQEAFMSCRSLQAICIPSGVEVIHRCLF